MTFTIEFQPSGVRYENKMQGATILECARRCDVEIDSACEGSSTCALCQVRVVSGQVTPLTYNEKSTFKYPQLEQGWRLACKTRPLSDCVVFVPPPE